MSILVGRRTVQVERVAGAYTSIVDFEPGRFQPAHAMADGKLLLAYLSEAERRFIYEGSGLRRYTPNTIVDPTELEQEFEKIRSRGYSVDNYERFEAGRGRRGSSLGCEWKTAGRTSLCWDARSCARSRTAACATNALSGARDERETHRCGRGPLNVGVRPPTARPFVLPNSLIQRLTRSRYTE